MNRDELIRRQDVIKAFCEDWTRLERNGVFTLTTAEAKQRAVDIVESIPSKLHIHHKVEDEPHADGVCKDCKWHDKKAWWYIKCEGCRKAPSYFEPKEGSE